MKFEDMPLRIPTEEGFKQKIEPLIIGIESAKTKEEAIDIVKQFFNLTDEVETDSTIISIRSSIDTRDEIYKDAYEKVCDVNPIIENYKQTFYKKLVNSPFRNDLEKRFGKLLFERIESSFKCFNESIIPELQEEGKLAN